MSKDKVSDVEKTRKYREKFLIEKWGFTLEKYELMLKVQNYVCAGCGKSDKTEKSFNIDHDHSTKLIRGLLCDSCNLALGLLKDNPEVLRKLADYVDKTWQEQIDKCAFLGPSMYHIDRE